MIDIQLISESDWLATWRIIEPVFRAGETYPYSPAISSADARKVWMETPLATYIAKDESGRPKIKSLEAAC